MFEVGVLEMPSTLKAICIVSVMLITLLYAVYENDIIENISESSKSYIISELPEFEVTDVYTQKKINKKTLMSSPKTVYFVHFWGTWCAPCEVEFPDLIKLSRNFEKKDIKFVFLAVNDNEKKIKKFLRRFKDLPKNIIIAIDNTGKSMKDFGTIKVPETYVYDGNGKSLKKFVGPQEWALPFFKNILDKITQ